MAKRSPSFFKILIGDFESELRIPPAFVKNVFEEKVPIVFTLYSSDSGSSWQVGVRVQQGNYFFSSGWFNFVKYHHFEISDFLVFFLVGSSTFDVLAYDPTECAKTITPAAKRRRGQPPLVEETTTEKRSSISNKAKAKEVSRTSNVSQDNEFVSEATAKHVSFERNTFVAGKRPRGRPRKQIEEPPGKKRAPSSKRTMGLFINLHLYDEHFDFHFLASYHSNYEIVSESSSEQASFSVVLKNYQEHNVVVPMEFAQEMGLAEKSSSVIRDSKGRKWTVNILVDGGSTVRLGAGWAKCVKDNKLELGDTISFKHIPNTGNVINIEIISKAGDGAGGKRNRRENSC